MRKFWEKIGPHWKKLKYLEKLGSFWENLRKVREFMEELEAFWKKQGKSGEMRFLAFEY